uniref:Uncharacterized protein n=1 Tax=Salix viminalis TaxID=40686 RepID=A0A6N2MPG7_SALVM
MRAKVVIAVEFLGSVSEGVCAVAGAYVEEEANEEVEEEAQKDEAEIQAIAVKNQPPSAYLGQARSKSRRLVSNSQGMQDVAFLTIGCAMESITFLIYICLNLRAIVNCYLIAQSEVWIYASLQQKKYAKRFCKVINCCTWKLTSIYKPVAVIDVRTMLSKVHELLPMGGVNKCWIDFG